MFSTVPIHEPGILHHPPSIARLFFSAPELQFQFGNLIVEGSQASDCRVIHWGDRFLLQVFFPWATVFSLRIPCLVAGVPALISQLSTSHLCALLLRDLLCHEPWSTGWDLASQTHHFPPDTRFTNIPQMTCPASQGKALPARGWHIHLLHPMTAMLPKGRLPKEAKARRLCAIPVALGLQGTGFPKRWHCSVY